MHEIPSLKYKYSDLEPFIDEETMRLHHTKHHQTYVDKLNAALEPYPDLANLPIEELLRNLSKFSNISEVAKKTIINNAGGHYNHCRYWETIGTTGTQLLEQTITLIDRDFGDRKNFERIFKETALKVFGSGWVWLIIDKTGKLNIATSPNQDTPIMLDIIPNSPLKPIIALDLWEHAYYLKYQNRRAEYVDAFFKVIDWEGVEQRIFAAKIAVAAE